MELNDDILEKAMEYTSHIDSFNTEYNNSANTINIQYSVDELLDTVDKMLDIIDIADIAMDIYEDALEEYDIDDDLMEVYIRLAWALHNEDYKAANLIKQEILEFKQTPGHP